MGIFSRRPPSSTSPSFVSSTIAPCGFGSYSKIEIQEPEPHKLNMSRKLFGTDGIRGVAGEPPLDEATVSAFGFALGKDLREHVGDSPVVLIGMDTRESGLWIAE